MAPLTDTTSYRPFDFVDPDLTINTCTHIEKWGRDTGVMAKCSGFANGVTNCFADTDCHFNPTAPILVANSGTTSCPSLTANEITNANVLDLEYCNI